MDYTITRPLLRYFGSKFRLAPWIIPLFPEHTTYVEPFGGGAGILLRKSPSYNEVYNDLDGEVVNLFRVLRTKPYELIAAIQLTPYSRQEQRLSFEQSNNDLERARRLYVRCWQSHGGGRTQWRSGWRYEIGDKRGKKVVNDWNETKHLWSIVERLKTVQIENDDAIQVIKRYDSPDTLFYLDPPYLPEVRSDRWNKKAYTCELDSNYHKGLAEILNNITGMAIISGYQSEKYDQWFPGWINFQKKSRTDFQSEGTECVWLSPNLQRKQKQLELEIFNSSEVTNE